MAEYIDRKAVCAEIDKGDLLVGNNAEWAKEIIHRTPTADVVEVRHGKAICGDHDEWWGAVYECSLCGEKWMLECSSYKAKYCPWCGSKLDGERKEAEVPDMGHLW